MLKCEQSKWIDTTGVLKCEQSKWIDTTGVRLLWLMRPRERSNEVYQPQQYKGAAAVDQRLSF